MSFIGSFRGIQWLSSEVLVWVMMDGLFHDSRT
jgi:hypothetical protein